MYETWQRLLGSLTRLTKYFHIVPWHTLGGNCENLPYLRQWVLMDNFPIATIPYLVQGGVHRRCHPHESKLGWRVVQNIQYGI